MALIQLKGIGAVNGMKVLEKALYVIDIYAFSGRTSPWGDGSC